MQLLGGSMNSIRGNTTQLLDYNIEVEDTASEILFLTTRRMVYFSQQMLVFRIVVLNYKLSLKMKSLP